VKCLTENMKKDLEGERGLPSVPKAQGDGENGSFSFSRSFFRHSCLLTVHTGSCSSAYSKYLKRKFVNLNSSVNLLKCL